MDGFYLSRQLDERRTLCVAPLTDRRIAMSGQIFQDASGYFLFEKEGDSEVAAVRVIAHFTSEEAALWAGDLLHMT